MRYKITFRNGIIYGLPATIEQMINHLKSAQNAGMQLSDLRIERDDYEVAKLLHRQAELAGKTSDGLSPAAAIVDGHNV